MMTKQQAYSISAAALAARGRDQIPAELLSSTQLIYNSPAALAFNSPGARGFGVKRAGLSIPGSVMLLIGPGCCGRNTTILSAEGGYGDRFFFYVLDETDIVTGRHLYKIPRAVEEILDVLPQAPSAVVLCLTCVDALLGTDMERVCRKAEARVHLPVVPCYMYALTREGRRPPMVAVRQMVYSLLKPQPRHRREANLLGFFSPLQDDCELYGYLQQLGIQTVREIGRCRTMEDYQQLSRANFNLVLHPEARLAAQDFEKNLHIPSIELTRIYETDRLSRQYQALAQALGGTIDDRAEREATEDLVRRVGQRWHGTTVAVGEMLNGNAFELALTLARAGLTVKEIYGNVTPQDFVWIKALAALAPETKIYCNLGPSMLYYDRSTGTVDLTLGADAAWYHPHSVHVTWDEDVQPFGYAGTRALFSALDRALSGRSS